MAVVIHAIVQDPDDIQSVPPIPIVDHMRSGREPHVSGTHIDGASLLAVMGQGQTGITDFVGVPVSLIPAPGLRAVIPDAVDICCWREGEGFHPASNSARFRALKLSKSKGRGSPDCSPAIRASCRALTFASCSSSRRSPPDHVVGRAVAAGIDLGADEAAEVLPERDGGGARHGDLLRLFLL